MDDFDTADQYLDTGDGAKAIQLFEKVAERGRVDAMHSIAHTYLYGVAGVKQDYDAAFRWFTRAANGGCPQAMYHLGMCNAEGYGTAKNPKQAFEWYKKSASRGDEDAEYRVGLCYETGLGAQQDMKEAMKWYKQAAAHGQEDAAEKIRQAKK